MPGTSETSDAAKKTWSAIFPDYTISGIASCNSLTGTSGTAYPEYNNQITAGYQTDGDNCWCRMTSPVRSAWVFLYTPGSDCAERCVLGCGYNVRAAAPVRTAIITSAGQ